ncbi:hypothetical protein [Luethyella okanaganae]|uniref:Uncharacterized protein n=1 Tax=Luethyella okanaganae TaxID=69372 RepID=A0ABW1VCY3_9MICO
MQWLNDFIEWISSSGARPVVFSAAVIVVAIIASGLLAAWIARGATRHLIKQRDREIKAATIAALIDAATEASVWNSLTPQEQVLSDRAVGQADIQVRMLPIRGAATAANWAAHQLHEFKRSSATFGYQLDPAVAEFRDRLVEWQRKPSRARKIFQNDLERWKLQSNERETSLLAEQDAWVAQQHHEQFVDSPAIAPIAPVSLGGTAPLRGAPSTETQRLLDDVDAIEARRQTTTGSTETITTP